MVTTSLEAVVLQSDATSRVPDATSGPAVAVGIDKSQKKSEKVEFTSQTVSDTAQSGGSRSLEQVCREGRSGSEARGDDQEESELASAILESVLGPVHSSKRAVSTSVGGHTAQSDASGQIPLGQ